MIKYNENSDDNSKLPFFIKQQNVPARGQVQVCYTLIAISFEKGNSSLNKNFLKKE